MSAQAALDLRPSPSPVPAQRTAPLRVAIISTPRSGNNWLLHMLSTAYAVPRLSFNIGTQLPYKTMPEECVLITHVHPLPHVVAGLREQGFRTVVLARHPLDVLFSILQYVLHYGSARWLRCENGNEDVIQGVLPRSPAFMDYATGVRFGTLLAISGEWWQPADAQRVRYEDLVADPQRQLRRLMDSLGWPARAPLADAVAGNTMSQLRQLHAPRRHHYWQGKVGLWKGLLTAREACRIAEAQADAFAGLGYECDPDPELTEAQADSNWLHLVWPSMLEEIDSLARTREALRNTEQAHRDALAELDQTRIRLNSYRDHLGPIAFALAKKVHRLSLSWPRISGLVKRLIGRLS